MSQQARIFVIDDSDIARELVSLILEDAGFEVQSSETPFDQHAALASFQPTLILLDLGIPGLTEDELPHVIEGYRAACGAKVVLHSANASEQILRSEQLSGADGSIEKTDEDEAFVASVRALL